MAQTFGLSALVSCLRLAPIPSCVRRKNSIWSTHPLPTELPVPCEIPDAVGVWGWYKRFLSCMGTIYPLMHSSAWLPTCLAWGVLSVVFVISRKTLIFLIGTCWEHRNIPHLHLLLPSTEWEHKPLSRFLELSTAQIKESPLACVTLKHVDLISIPTATMTFPEAFVCTVVTSTTFQGGYRLVKVQTLSGLIVVKETNLSTCKKLW